MLFMKCSYMECDLVFYLHYFFNDQYGECATAGCIIFEGYVLFNMLLFSSIEERSVFLQFKSNNAEGIINKMYFISLNCYTATSHK